MYGNTTFVPGQQPFTGSFEGGGGTIEPAWDDADNGGLVYLQTPNNAHINVDPAQLPKNVSPLYLMEYPATSTIDPATLNCPHVPADTCPDHGPIIVANILGAIAAHAVPPSVATLYSGGAIGHDHLVGIRPTGGDFNVIWEPILVLFTDAAAANVHVTTLSGLSALQGAGKVIEIPQPALSFHCSVVSAGSYNRGTPAPTIVGP
jgi:hypothetical protein